MRELGESRPPHLGVGGPAAIRGATGAVRRRGAAVALGCAFALALVEVVARVAEPFGDIGEFARHLDVDTLGCARPSLTRIYEIVGRCGRDAHGFLLDQARPLGNPSARRVLVIGDSVGEQSWTLHLADALEAQGRGQVEVWNASVGGYGTCQEAAAARELFALARPDVVVVETCANDVFGSPAVLAGPGGTTSVVVGARLRTFPSAWLRSAAVRAVVARMSSGAGAQSSVAAARGCAQDLVATVGDTPLVVVHFPALVDDPGHPLLADEADVLAAWADAPGIRLRERLAPLGPLSRLRESSRDAIHPREAVQADIAATFVEDVAAAMR